MAKAFESKQILAFPVPFGTHNFENYFYIVSEIFSSLKIESSIKKFAFVYS